MCPPVNDVSVVAGLPKEKALDVFVAVEGWVDPNMLDPNGLDVAVFPNTDMIVATVFLDSGNGADTRVFMCCSWTSVTLKTRWLSA